MAEHVCIGIQVHAGPGELIETLRSVRLDTRFPVDVVLLPDGPDELTTEVLRGDSRLSGYPQWGTAESLGGAACLNRLAARSGADVLVLLESGVQVGPRWLELLLRSLRRPGCGLAGPSTNRSRNEQAIFPDSPGDRAGIRRTAAEAIRRYGWAARSLEPLYSLAGFCYAVRREVFDVTGGADEGYGLAPYWDMDLNIRAARAGFSGLWTGGAYVHRSPPGAGQVARNELLVESGKRRYQDRLCGLRLVGRSSSYRAQCEGDTCEHFAPRVGLPVRVPKDSGQARQQQRRAVSAPAADQAQARPARARPAQPRPARPRPALAHPAQVVGAVVTAGAAAMPMVSCIMPTYDRRRFVPLAISYFLRQDYTNAELVIVDDGTDPVGDLVPNHPAIRYHRLDNRMVLGAKRNLACDQALGEIIVHWDDDDWSAPDRLLVQVNRLEVTGAEICGMRSLRFYDPAKRLAWRYAWPDGRRPWAAGTSLCYRRGLWERSPYAEVAAGEDTRFVWRAAGGPIADVSDTDCVIALIHDRNTVPKTGRGAYWSRDPVIEVERVLGADVTLYHTEYQRLESRRKTKERCDVTG